MGPTIVTIAGFSSNVGKTTVVCELLKRFPGWEAVKISRGHYRSCGKDPAACCVSPMLGERHTLFSGRAETCVPGKDTGRFWEAGARNVHWLICTNDQLEAGTREALARVQSAGVFIEGTSVLNYVPADYSVMVVSAGRDEIKSSALRIIDRVQAFYVFDSAPDDRVIERIRSRLPGRNFQAVDRPIYFQGEIERLISAHLPQIRSAQREC